jgi:hypothetical protein
MIDGRVGEAAFHFGPVRLASSLILADRATEIDEIRASHTSVRSRAPGAQSEPLIEWKNAFEPRISRMYTDKKRSATFLSVPIRG